MPTDTFRISIQYAMIFVFVVSIDEGYYNIQKTNSGNSGANNVANTEALAYSYAYSDEVPSLQSTQNRQQQQLPPQQHQQEQPKQPQQQQQHSQQKSVSSAHRDYQQQNRARRTQRRVTHNEKRYHSGK